MNLSMIAKKIVRKIKRIHIESCFKNFGSSSHLGKGYHIDGPENISIGSNTYINTNCTLMSSDSTLTIGNHVMISPNVSFITGNHRTDVVGEYMINVKEKLPNNDEEIIIEDDVWIGAGATILKGTVIGRGCVIGAGSIIGSMKILPYSICLGNPVRIVQKRFDKETIEKHEKLLKEKYGEHF